MAEEFTCSLLELDVIGEALHLDVRPFPFVIPTAGPTLKERAEQIRAVDRRLTEQGLVRDGELAPAVAELIGLFAAGRWSISMLGTTGEGMASRRDFCARAGSNGRSAVLAEQRGDHVRFKPITAPSLIHAVVGVLPSLKPGIGSSITVATADLRAATGSNEFPSEGFLQRMTPSRGPAGSQLAVLAAVLRRPRTGAGYFVATSRRRDGRESPPVTVTWLDTDAGRYALVDDRSSHVVCSPASRSRIEQHLVRLMSTAE